MGLKVKEMPGTQICAGHGRNYPGAQICAGHGRNYPGSNLSWALKARTVLCLFKLIHH